MLKRTYVQGKHDASRGTSHRIVSLVRNLRVIEKGLIGTAKESAELILDAREVLRHDDSRQREHNINRREVKPVVR